MVAQLVIHAVIGLLPFCFNVEMNQFFVFRINKFNLELIANVPLDINKVFKFLLPLWVTEFQSSYQYIVR